MEGRGIPLVSSSQYEALGHLSTYVSYFPFKIDVRSLATSEELFPKTPRYLFPVARHL